MITGSYTLLPARSQVIIVNSSVYKNACSVGVLAHGCTSIASIVSIKYIGYLHKNYFK